MIGGLCLGWRGREGKKGGKILVREREGVVVSKLEDRSK